MGVSILRKSIHLTLALAAASLLASAAVAGGGSSGVTIVAPCGSDDVTGAGVTLLGCSGYISGNLISGGQNSALLSGVLANLPYGSSDPTGLFLAEKSATFTADRNGPGGTLTLPIPLKAGVSIIGIHYGGGGNTGPGSQSTALYVLDAAQGVSQLHLKYSSFSNAGLFVTGLTRHVPAAPEPGTWATMILGFGFTGYQMRRRKRAAAKLA